MAGWLKPEARARRLLLAIAIWATATAVYFACAPRSHIVAHTPFNHYALLADAWLHHRLDLGHPPPAYTQNNDFAEFQGKYFISFPPFPAVILLPFAKLAGEPENLRDGQIWLWLAGIAPAVLFLALEKLRRTGRSDRSERTNVLLSFLFAFGTVYFFTAEQGTVWFSAHVVGAILSAIFLYAAIAADRPLLAGVAIGLAHLTRPSILLASVLFAFEAVRASCPGGLPAEGSLAERVRGTWRALDVRALSRRLVLFSIPVAVLLGVALWYNKARFGNPFIYGHEYLTVGWRGRIERWGLFSYHFLARNLGVMLTSLPYLNQVPHKVQINTHGIALWLTTPAYVWLLWPKRKPWLWYGLGAASALVAGQLLLYQNSGWLQFGYRFSNDYAVFLFAMLAVGGFRFGKLFWALAVWAVAINAFGALTFDRDERFYFSDASQKILYQSD